MTATEPSRRRNRAVLVVGAGRSGTSALTRGLASLGVDLGDNLKPATAKNPTGFWEDADLLRVGKAVRAHLGLNAESVALVEDDAWQDPALEPFYAEAAEIIEERFGDTPLWGFKYAQTLRLLPFWLQVLERSGVDPSWVVASRNPLSVSRSRRKLDRLRGIQEKSDLEWLVSVVPYFQRIAHQPCVVVDFDSLMHDPAAQLLRIAQALDLPVDDGIRDEVTAYAETFLVDGMRHTLFDPNDVASDARINPLTRDAFGWLYKLSTDEIRLDDPAFLEDWARIERSLCGQAAVLRYVDRLVAGLREAEVRGLRGIPPRALKRLKRVRWIAAGFGAWKLRRDISRSTDGRAAGRRP